MTLVYALLPQEVIQLSSRLKHKSDQVSKLQHMLSEKSHDGASSVGHAQAPPTTGKKTSLVSKLPVDDAMLRLKENVAPPTSSIR